MRGRSQGMQSPSAIKSTLSTKYRYFQPHSALIMQYLMFKYGILVFHLQYLKLRTLTALLNEYFVRKQSKHLFSGLFVFISIFSRKYKNETEVKSPF